VLPRSANRGAVDVVGEIGETENRMSVRSFSLSEGLDGDWYDDSNGGETAPVLLSVSLFAELPAVVVGPLALLPEVFGLEKSSLLSDLSLLLLLLFLLLLLLLGGDIGGLLGT